MADEMTVLGILLAVYKTETGVPGDPDTPLLETLSSLQLMGFLLAVEAAIPGAPIFDINDADLASPRVFARSLARQPG